PLPSSLYPLSLHDALPILANASPIQPHTLMLIVGVIEVVAGIGVWFKPRIFAYIVAVWLVVIIINLLLIPGYFDIALRDFGLFLDRKSTRLNSSHRTNSDA